MKADDKKQEVKPAERTRVEFVRKALGPWSSHPLTASGRSWRWLLIGAVPLLGGVALFVFAWRLGVFSLVKQVPNWAIWVTVALSLLLMGLAFAMTAVLCVRASKVRYLREEKPPEATLSFPLICAISGGGVLVGFGLFIAILGDWPIIGEYLREMRWLGMALCVLPLIAVDIYLEFAGQAIDGWGHDHTPQRELKYTLWLLTRRCISALSFCAPLLLIAGLADGISDYYIRKYDWLANLLNQWAPQWMTPSIQYALTVVASISIGVMLVAQILGLLSLRRAFTRMEPCNIAAVGAVRVARRQGYLTRPAGESFVMDPNAQVQARPAPIRWCDAGESGDTPSEAFEADGELAPLNLDSGLSGIGVILTGGSGAKQGDAIAADASSAEKKAGASEQKPDIEQPDSKKAKEPPEWLTKLRESVTEAIPTAKLHKTVREIVGSGSFVTSAADLQYLFLVDTIAEGCADEAKPAKPTVDQAKALRAFDRQFEEFLSANDHTGQCVFPAADMLVSGPDGSGRSTLLMAVAMNVAVFRGQSVLVIVSDDKQAQTMVARIRDVANRVGEGWGIAVGLLERDNVFDFMLPEWRTGAVATATKAPWLDPCGVLPDILVGTVGNYEHLLYGSDLAHAMVRRSLLRLQCVLIEDISKFEPTERRHLPFIIDKHRLVLGADRLPVQFMALCSELSDSSAEYISHRLFSQKVNIPHMRLKPVVGSADA